MIFRPPRKVALAAGAAFVAIGLAAVARALAAAGVLGALLPALLPLTNPLGPLSNAFRAVSVMTEPGVDVPQAHAQLALGIAVTLVGVVIVGFFARRSTPAASNTPGELLIHPTLSRFVDFHWGTLAAYGFSLFIAEVAFCVVYILLAGRAAGAAAWPPATAFSLSLALALAVVLIGGFIGASHARRLSIPEATVALFLFGLAIPLWLTRIHTDPVAMVRDGYRMQDILYLASLLGEARPEIGYWLVTCGLALGLFFGMTLGFVASSSGRVDLRLSYELFIAGRHAQVFRVRLVASVLAVLVLGIVPPLLLWGMVRAAAAVTERARIRRLGERDAMAAAEAAYRLNAHTNSPTAMMTALSVGGVGVGVMSLIIVLSVMNGFEADLQQKILGTHADGVVLKAGPEMPEFAQVQAKIRAVRGVIGTTPFVLNEGMVSSPANISGAIVKGIDPATTGEVTDLPTYILPGGKLEWLSRPEDIPTEASPPASPDNPALQGIIVGRELAAALHVSVGEVINVISPLGGELGPQGPMPKGRAFRVAGIFYSGMYDYDAKIVYLRLEEAASFFGVAGATGIEVKVDDVDRARSTMRAVENLLDGYPYRTKDWGEMNRSLFSALRLEKLVMGIILSIIVVVAAGLIVATVIMLVLDKRKEIAVLKALGVPDAGVVKIFLAEGLQIGILGSILGLVAGLLWCLFIERVGIRLDPQVYYIPALPVRVEPFETVLAVVVAVAVTFLATIYPALKAAQVEPAEGLRAE